MILDPALDLSLTREIALPPAVLFACWTQSQHIPQFFVPKPHRVVACHIDLRVGGAFILCRRRSDAKQRRLAGDCAG